MPVTTQMLEVLKKIYTDTRHGGHAFVNAKSPMVRACVTNGFLMQLKRQDGAPFTDPSDADKMAYALTDVGAAELPPAMMAAQPAAQPGIVQPNVVVQPGAMLTDPGAAYPQAAQLQDPAAAPANTAAPKAKKPRGPRVVPEIAHTGARFNAIPQGIPHGKGVSKAKELYPFATLGAVGQNSDGSPSYDTFFVAPTAAMPDPYKAVRPAVNSANKRFLDKGIKFQAVDVALDIEHQIPGVRVFRIA